MEFYSSGYCSGFTPDSLKLIPEVGLAHHYDANISKIWSTNSLVNNFVRRSYKYLYAIGIALVQVHSAGMLADSILVRLIFQRGQHVIPGECSDRMKI